MRTLKQFGGKTRLAKKKEKFAKEAQVYSFPTFSQMYKYRSVLPVEHIRFLQNYKRKYKNTLDKEDIEEMEEDGGYWSDEESKQKFIEFHKNTLSTFIADDSDADFQQDEDNVLDMNIPMTDDYLEYLKYNHVQKVKHQYDNDKMWVRSETRYLRKSYDDFEELKKMPRLFLLYWAGLNTSKLSLKTKVPYEIADHITSYVTRTEKYEKLFSRNSSNTKTRRKS